jgi:hypothetical protein
MARKVINRRELREQSDAAEARGDAAGADVEAGEEGATGGKVKKKKAATKRKSRAKSTEPARLKLFWGVFNQASKRIAKYDFTQKKQADTKAAELSAAGGGKNPHFVAKVKEAVEE